MAEGSVRKSGFYLPRRVLILTGLLLCQIAGVYGLTLTERGPGKVDFGELPLTVGSWHFVEQLDLQQDVVDYLRPDSYVHRVYRGGDESVVTLFAAFFRSFRSGYGPHSPKHCLPGSGWLQEETKVIEIPVEGATRPIPVNSHLLQKADSRILVHYWYQNARTAWADEVWAKLYLLPDLLVHRSSDVTLVRLITPVNDKNVPRAERQLREFARRVYPDVQAQLARR